MTSSKNIASHIL